MSLSLAKTIIYGTEKDLLSAVNNIENLNEIDEYGYTPLTQAAIVDSVSKAKILLEARLGNKIDVNFQDLTGRTALHWAADNNNYNFFALLRFE